MINKVSLVKLLSSKPDVVEDTAGSRKEIQKCIDRHGHAANSINYNKSGKDFNDLPIEPVKYLV